MSQSLREFVNQHVGTDVATVSATCDVCCACKKPFTEAQRQAQEIHRTEKGLCCSDCYYGLVGDEVEKHPLHTPRSAPHPLSQ